MDFNITVLSSNKSTAMSKAGKSYQLFEVAYKNNSFQGKVESYKVNQYSSVFSNVAEFQPGQQYTVTKEKEGDFWQWKKVIPLVPGSVPEQQGLSTQGKTVQVKSTYETPAERAKKQIYIIRQSSISSAVDTLVAGAKSAPKPEDVLAVAQQYYSWVMADPNDTVKQDVFSIPNDIEVE